MQHISKLMDMAAVSLVPVRQEPRPLKTSDEEIFEQSLSDVKLKECTYEQFKETLKYCIMLIGLRAQNFPTEEEKQYFFVWIGKNYPGHTLAEVRLAFDMAIQRKLDLEEKEIACYENFTLEYFSKIINAYRVWAKDVYRKIEAKPVLTLLPHSMHYHDWRSMIEKDYQLFMTDGKAFWRTWPADYYDQVVEDGFVAATVYREQMKEAKIALCSDLQKKITIAQAEAESDSKRYNGLKDYENRLIEYRNGSRDAEIILLAKQYCVLMLFTQAKAQGYKNLYIQNETI